MAELIYFFRVVVAAVCGVLIGYERKSRSKVAGIRTHCIVACAAALIMIVSKYAFFDLIERGMFEGIEVKLDPSRIASCIVSGVGFLGAGMIFVQKQTIKGLTTAAGIWATAGIGMAIGSGLYTIGILVTLLILFVQFIFHRNSKLMEMPRYKTLTITNVTRHGYYAEISEKLKEICILVDDDSISYNKENESYTYVFTIELPQNLSDEDVISIIEYDALLEVSR